MKFTWLTAAFFLLLPHSVDAQSDTQPRVAARSMDVATTDEAVAEQHIEQLARAYRVSVYNAFRTNRAAYNQYRAVLEETFAAWHAAGSPAEQHEKLVAWLTEATRAVQSAPPGPLPTRPVFDVKIASEKPKEQTPKPDMIAPAIKRPVHKPSEQPKRADKTPPARPSTADLATSPNPPLTAQPHQTLKPTLSKADEPKVETKPEPPVIKSPKPKPATQKPATQKPPVQKLPVQKPPVQKPDTPKPSTATVPPPAQKPAAPQQKQTFKPSLPKVEETAPALPLPATVKQPSKKQPSKKQPSQIVPAIEPPTQKSATKPSVSIPKLPTPIITAPSRATPPSIPAGKEQHARRPRPSTRQRTTVKKPAATQRQTTQIPILPTLGDSDITPPPSATSQAKQPARITPSVSPPQRSAKPSSSLPPTNRLAESTKRTTTSQLAPSRTTASRTLADRRSWRSPRRAAATPSARPKTSSGLDKKSPGRTPTLPALPGLSAKDLAGVDKNNKNSLALPKNTVDKDSDGEVNLIELAARIAGTNMGLRGVETQLSKSREWDSTQLTSMVTALKQLSDRRRDLILFRNLLPESDRRLVGQLESPRAAISQCSTRISETRTRVEGSSYRSRPKERKEELKRLDELSHELAKLVTAS